MSISLFGWHIRKRTLLLVALIIVVIWFMRSDEVRSGVELLTPADLPELKVKGRSGQWLPQIWLEQNWGNKMNAPSAETKKYHHLSQGTRTLPIPYNWLVNLEQPASSPWLLPFSSSDKFIAPEHLLRFGFIRSEPDPVNNPHGLPIGFARTFSQNVDGYSNQTAAVGFTCAGCHTGHFIYDNGETGPKEYIVEGGPASTDLGLLGKSLTAALGQTVLSSKLPLMGGRFDRFARNVLGPQYSPSTKLALSKELLTFVSAQVGASDIIEVTEGFTRLDALNRIGNGVFSDNIHRPHNYAPIDAPVNYPHLWTTSWFDWVQYDGSVMGPLIRNVGEALGVKAFMDVVSSTEDYRFSSSVPIDNLVWMEEFLSGPQPTPDTGFAGLGKPKWVMTPLDQGKVKQGEALYIQHCQGCHLPPIDSPEIWQNGHMAPIVWNDGLQEQRTEDVLKLKIIPISQIGTDPQQSKVMVNRTMDTSNVVDGPVSEHLPGMGLDSPICVRDANVVSRSQLLDQVYSYQQGYNQHEPEYANGAPLISLWIHDGGNIGFGYALAATVQQTIDAWFKVNGITDPQLQKRMEAGRPNCIQAGAGYKARPLNGVWATPPFLHNGSIASIRDLICPVDGQRPRFVQLGNPVYDVNTMGIKQPDGFQRTAQEMVDKNRLYDDEGYFVMDSSVLGNHNSGHEFSDRYEPESPYWQQPKGVIGPKLSTSECGALMEYLKVL